ncbi:hypothetical protein [Polaribacter cellanae]|uniref:Uncharacterized protein n=1 Tax=Polaribacter cellanae TaxID=2818493 RepID=A0A975CL73_9FLAO|nr:hypothetical protein [Polaribacter cellanae]QTE21142.1 hypothetical protein J3359_09790 [Polaribacter cellanae]
MNSKQKNIFLIGSFILLSIISYVFSIQKTLDLKTRLTNLQKDEELLSNASQKILDLQQQNSYFDSILKQNDLSIENSFQQTLLRKLNSFSVQNPIEIIAFNEPHTIKENTADLKTYVFEVKADFISLLKLTNSLERQQLGKLVSVNIEKKKNYRSRKEELIGKFFMQKLTQQE